VKRFRPGWFFATVAPVTLVAFAAGCAQSPLLDNPSIVPADGPNGVAAGNCENPILLYPGQDGGGIAYAETFDRVLDVIDDYFRIQSSNRYDGRIICEPTIAAGYEQPWKNGTPDARERLLVTNQSYRHRCEIKIREAEPAGYFVQVIVLKELKDQLVPSSPNSNLPIFGDAGTVDRDFFVVVDPSATSPVANRGQRWIPKGRDVALEQMILRKLQRLNETR
jgi:hypothetical protein